MKHLRLVLLVLTGCGSGSGSPGACPFVAQCSGTGLQTCMSQVGGLPPQITTRDCGSGATCVQDRGVGAQCVGSCDGSTPPYCVGDLLVGCDFSSGQGLLTAIDCQNGYGNCDPDYGCDFGGTCIDFGGGNAHCQP